MFRQQIKNANVVRTVNLDIEVHLMGKNVDVRHFETFSRRLVALTPEGKQTNAVDEPSIFVSRTTLRAEAVLLCILYEPLSKVSALR